MQVGKSLETVNILVFT